MKIRNVLLMTAIMLLWGNAFEVQASAVQETGNAVATVQEVEEETIPDGIWSENFQTFYYKDGKIATDFTGIVMDEGNSWYIENGVWNVAFKGVVEYDNKLVYVQVGHINEKYAGIAEYNGDKWYFENGEVNFDYEGLLIRNGYYYIRNGKVDKSFTGPIMAEGNLHYFIEGLPSDYTGMGGSGRDWWYFSRGVLDRSYTGLASNAYGWWYIEDGALNWNHTGFVENEYGSWAVVNGKVNFGVNGVILDPEYNQWIYTQNGRWVKEYTGLAYNKYGWWYIKNGKVDWDYTGLAANQYGWWYIKNGKLDFNFTGAVRNQHGVWYLRNGKLDTSYTDIAMNQYKQWWYIKNGKLDTSYTGVARNQYGWWYIEDGALNWNYTGVAPNEYGWWYIKNGALDRSFTGIATNEYGKWYVKNGKLDFGYTGYVDYLGNTYQVINGKATIVISTQCNLSIYSEYHKYEYAYRNNTTAGLSGDQLPFYYNLKECLDYAYQFTTPYERERAVHDYIVLNCAYDMGTWLDTHIVWDSYGAEGVFKNGSAVCDGYTKAFKLCMDILGIPCQRITGIANGGLHAWNAVQLDGQWYMVDVTWDDPIPDEEGRLQYDYFNVTDETLKKDHQYNSWVVANGTKYGYHNQIGYFVDLDSYYNYINSECLRLGKVDSITAYLKISDNVKLRDYTDGSRVTEKPTSGVSCISSSSNDIRKVVWNFRYN